MTATILVVDDEPDLETLVLQKFRKQISDGGIKFIFARDGVEGALAERLDALLLAGELPDLKRLREEFAPRQVALPQVTVLIPAARCYDALLPSAHEPPAVAA